MSKEYSVYQFFDNGEYEQVRRFVDLDEAIEAYKHYTTSVAARMGFAVKVIITDGGDLIVGEWLYGKGHLNRDWFINGK